jgi:hypothetical protein
MLARGSVFRARKCSIWVGNIRVIIGEHPCRRRSTFAAGIGTGIDALPYQSRRLSPGTVLLSTGAISHSAVSTYHIQGPLLKHQHSREKGAPERTRFLRKALSVVT